MPGNEAIDHPQFSMQGTFFRRQSVLAPSPNRNLVDESCHLRSLLAQLLLEQQLNNPPAHTAFFAQVSWPNIGPVAAGPAGPAPTALNDYLLLAN